MNILVVALQLQQENTVNYHVFARIFIGYDNVTILNASIYKYGFTNNRYDLIFSVPNFGTRSLAEDENFICRIKIL